MSEGEGSEDDNVVVLPVSNYPSDGTEATWRLNDPQFKYRQIDDTRWRLALAEMWVDKTGAKEPGMAYILESLPAGYGLFDRPRGTDHTMRDAFLFGHPSGFYYQSRVTFFPHFYWLVTGREGDCVCHNCVRANKHGGPRKRRTKAEMLAARGILPSNTVTNGTPALPELNSRYPSDEEGPDYWRILIINLKEKGTLNVEIRQPLNLDWTLTHEMLEDVFVGLTLRAAYLPRRGEVVLWTPELDGKLEQDPVTKRVMIKKEDGSWAGPPDWRAGIITQTPVEECNLMDIVQLTHKQSDNVAEFGFRIETLPDPLSEDKSLSLHHKYVPLRNIKPFAAYESFLPPTSLGDFHPSIEYAMMTMASWSMLYFSRFEGTWPNAKLYAKAIWLGHEILAIKDVIRLKPHGLTLENIDQPTSTPRGSSRVTDVMVIEKIWLELNVCIDDSKDDQYAHSYEVRIAGKVYTHDANRLVRPCPFGDDPLTELRDHEVNSSFQVNGMQGYGTWYRIANGRTCVVSKSMVLGRCVEPEATYLTFHVRQLDYDLYGVLSGRDYSAKVDERIPEGAGWFWADYRAETLGLSTVNGVECGPSADERQDLPRWQAILRFLNDCPRRGDKKVAFKDPEESDMDGRGARPLNLAFAALGKTSSLVSTGLGQNAVTNGDHQGSDTGDSSVPALENSTFEIPIIVPPEVPDEDYEDDDSRA